MIQKSNAHQFSLFGYQFLIWRKKPNKQLPTLTRGIVEGSCKLIRLNNWIALSMPDGTIIPHQIDLIVESNLNEAATATVKLFVSIDNPQQP